MRARLRAEGWLLGIVGAGLGVFLVLPLVALVATSSFDELGRALGHPLVGPALRASLLTVGVSLALTLTFGTPLAWTLSRTQGRLGRAVEALIQLPIVIPPAVAGVAMLLAFGRRGLFAGWLPESASLAFTTAAVVMAQVFVSAPFYVQAAMSAFRRVDPELLLVARSFGAGPLRTLVRVALPLAAPGLVAGAVMSGARALGEFGATLMFAGNLEGRTQTLPLAIYTALETDLHVAQALSIILTAVAFALLLGVRAAQRRAR